MGPEGLTLTLTLALTLALTLTLIGSLTFDPQMTVWPPLQGH